MGVKARCGLFHGTSGAMKFKLDIQYFASKIFTKKGSVTDYSLKKHGQDLLDKNPTQIKQMMQDAGYDCHIDNSRQKPNSSTKIVIADNPSKNRNITQIQISPDGSSHHGKLPYVKISTKNIGIYKIIKGNKNNYKPCDEKAVLLFKKGRKNGK